MNWDLLIEDYFKLPEEDREQYIQELYEFYVKKWVNEEDEFTYKITLHDLIKKVSRSWKEFEKAEKFEEAEILFKVRKKLMKLKNSL